MDRKINAGPFARSFIVAGVVYAVFLAYLGVNVPDFPHKAGSLLGFLLFILLGRRYLSF